MKAYQRDDDEHGGSDGSHNVGPHTRAVHEPLKPAEVLLEQWAVVIVQHNLEVALQTANMFRRGQHYSSSTTITLLEAV